MNEAAIRTTALMLMVYMGVFAFALILLAVASAYGGPHAIQAPTPGTPVVPWHTFSEATPEVTQVIPVMCSTEAEPIAVVMRHGNEVFVLGGIAGVPRIAMLYDPAPDDPTAAPTLIGFGNVDPKNPDVIPSLTWEPFDPAKHRDLCRLLLGAPA